MRCEVKRKFKFIVIAFSVILFFAGLVSLAYIDIFEDNNSIKDGDLTYLLKGNDFTKGKWELIIDDHIGSYMYVNDNLALEKFKRGFYIIEESAPYYTTPNYTVDLYKDGKVIDGCSVDHLEKIKWGGLEKYITKVKQKTIETYSKNEYSDILLNKEVMNIKTSTKQTYKGLLEIVILFEEDIKDWDLFKKDLADSINKTYGLTDKVQDYFMKPYSTNNKYGIGIVISVGFYDIHKFDLEKMKHLDVLKDKKIKSIYKSNKVDSYIIEYDEIIT
jgi:hypothetical protein